MASCASAISSSVRASIRAQQETLAWQREINDRILRELRDGVLVIDDEDVVRYASQPLRQWLGREPVGERVEEVLPGVDRLLARRGGERWVAVQGRRLRCRATVPYRGGGWLAFVSDLEEVSREFERNKLASLGTMVSGVAHEVRNPLAAVVQALELMRGEENAAARERLLAMALDNAERIEHLVEDILSLGRRQRPQPEVLDHGHGKNLTFRPCGGNFRGGMCFEQYSGVASILYGAAPCNVFYPNPKSASSSAARVYGFIATRATALSPRPVWPVPGSFGWPKKSKNGCARPPFPRGRPGRGRERWRPKTKRPPRVELPRRPTRTNARSPSIAPL